MDFFFLNFGMVSGCSSVGEGQKEPKFPSNSVETRDRLLDCLLPISSSSL